MSSCRHSAAALPWASAPRATDRRRRPGRAAAWSGPWRCVSSACYAPAAARAAAGLQGRLTPARGSGAIRPSGGRARARASGAGSRRAHAARGRVLARRGVFRRLFSAADKMFMAGGPSAAPFGGQSDRQPPSGIRSAPLYQSPACGLQHLRPWSPLDGRAGALERGSLGGARRRVRTPPRAALCTLSCNALPTRLPHCAVPGVHQRRVASHCTDAWMYSRHCWRCVCSNNATGPIDAGRQEDAGCGSTALFVICKTLCTMLCKLLIKRSLRCKLQVQERRAI